MPNPTRRAVAIVALAAAIVAGAVALDLAPVAAQSDEQAGRIVAQRLADGRTEFGWQPAGAARVLPRARYFPADAQVDRWLNSSPVEVEGEAIGRINARLRSDGRIEFAFTPTDGERIEPPARYFPVDARVGRWLRSTEITISAAPVAGFIAVSAGNDHTCGLRTTGAIECWGANAHFYTGEYTGQSDAPEGKFVAVSAGNLLTCAIRESGEIACWGETTGSEWHPWHPLTGRYSAVEAGWFGVCAIRESGEIECSQDEDVLAGSYSAVSTGGTGAGRPGYHTCGVRESGEIECWGNNEGWHTNYPEEGGEYVWYGQATPPAGSFTAVSAGGYHTCAIRESDSAIECWGANHAFPFPTGATDAPAGSFTAVSAGVFRTCGLRSDSAIQCWGQNHYGENDAPAGSFSAVSVGLDHTCGLRTNGAIVCWGSNEYGQTNAPAP